MSFWHTYAFEGTTSTCYDGGTLEYTTDGGTTWTVVPAADFTAGAYTGTAGASYSNPIGGKPAWCGGTVGAMTQVSLNLGGDANLVNKTIRVRWHEGDDSSGGDGLVRGHGRRQQLRRRGRLHHGVRLHGPRRADADAAPRATAAA